ncbi:MAG: site-2 protease family protein, partial [Planctomycetes bacterium]|nr:site-2 protease family protein [Planctomycetota bacterium]
FKIRGTEYGIGALPLGGYVKLAGASDLPGEEDCTGAPDELMSKGVGSRGLIFIAGVVMNLVFGFFLLVGAQLYGVPRMHPVLGYVEESGPAYRAGLRSGDKVLTIDNKPIASFSDIQEAVAMSTGKPLRFTIERQIDTGSEQFVRNVVAEPGQGRGNIYQIMVQPSFSPIIDGWMEEGGELTELQKQIKIGDRIVKIDDEIIANDLEITALIRKKIGQEITLSVQSPEGEGWTEPRAVAAHVNPLGFYDLGLRYKYSVKSVESGSPAEHAGITPGDWIVGVSLTPGEPLYLTQDHPLSEQIKPAAFQEVALTVSRAEEPLELAITPRAMTADLRIPLGKDNFLGVLLQPESPQGKPVVSEVLSGGPAEGLLQAGDIITAINGESLAQGKTIPELLNTLAVKPVTIIVQRDTEPEELRLLVKPKVEPAIGVPRIGIIQATPRIYGVEPGSAAEQLALGPADTLTGFTISNDLQKTTLTWQREGELSEREETFATPPKVLAAPKEAGLYGTIGILPKANIFIDKSPSFLAACRSALPLTWEKTTTIFRFLGKLIGGDFSLTATGGPILIFKVMYASAEAGFGRLLDIAALISLNLAVLNILPIPVLDGGYLIFLLVELVKGSRPSARVREYAQYAGFIFLMGLMLLLTTFDVYYSWIQSWFGG